MEKWKVAYDICKFLDEYYEENKEPYELARETAELVRAIEVQNYLLLEYTEKIKGISIDLFFAKNSSKLNEIKLLVLQLHSLI